MSTPLFTGLATALVTPFIDGGVNYDALAQLIHRQKSAGTSAIVVCGTTGEAPTLTQDEKNDILAFSVKETHGSMKVIAGIGGNDTMAAAHAAKVACALGADGLMLTTPYYNKANETGIIRHFSYVADHAEIPLILYNVPGRTCVRCNENIYSALSDHPRICGIKEASGDLGLVSRTLKLCGDKLTVWSGNDDQTFLMMTMGAKGVISVASNIIPEVINSLCGYCLTDDVENARCLHYQYSELFDVLFSDVNPIPIKTAMNLMGMNAGILRLPLHSMDSHTFEKLRHCLECLGLIA